MLLDAFGWKFVQRHADHPFLRRLADRAGRLAVPVDDDRAPDDALHRAAGRASTGSTSGTSTTRGWTRSSCRCRSCRPGRDRCRSTRATSCPARRCSSSSTCRHWCSSSRRSGPGSTARRRSRAHAWSRSSASRRRPRSSAAPGLTYLYWDAIDATGHRHGPSSREFDAAALAALDALDRVRDTVHPRHRRPRADRRGRARRLPRRAVAAAARAPDAAGPGGLGARLLPARARAGDRGRRAGARGSATAPRSASPPSSSRTPARACSARLADVCVLPAPGRMAWLRSNPSHQLRFKGHHGGRTPEESETWVGIMQT